MTAQMMLEKAVHGTVFTGAVLLRLFLGPLSIV